MAACCTWYLVFGALSGWLAYWLFDKYYRRDNGNDRQNGKWIEPGGGLAPAAALGVPSLARELDAERMRLKTAQADLETARRANTEHTETVRRLQAELDAGRRQLSEHGEQRDKLKAELDAARGHPDQAVLLEKAQSELASVREELATKSEQLTRALASAQQAEAQAEHARADSVQRQQLLANLKSELDLARQRVVESESAQRSLLAQMRALGITASAPTQQIATKPADRDDLTVIDGITPAVDELLQSHGIDTFAKLAATRLAHLQHILLEAGAPFRGADPASWLAQAQFCIRGDWEGLRSHQQQTRGHSDTDSQ